MTADVDPGDRQWAARQVIRQHTEQPERIDEGAIPLRQTAIPSRASGRCAHCTDAGECRMLVWAEAELGAASRRTA